MQDKHKVTLYLPPELHRQLKIRSAVELEAMSAIAERAIIFYLEHSDVVDELDIHGQSHRVYSCPQCSSSLVLRQGEILPVGDEPGILMEDCSSTRMSDMTEGTSRSGHSDEGELVLVK